MGSPNPPEDVRYLRTPLHQCKCGKLIMTSMQLQTQEGHHYRTLTFDGNYGCEHCWDIFVKPNIKEGWIAYRKKDYDVRKNKFGVPYIHAKGGWEILGTTLERSPDNIVTEAMYPPKPLPVDPQQFRVNCIAWTVGITIALLGLIGWYCTQDPLIGFCSVLAGLLGGTAVGFSTEVILRRYLRVEPTSPVHLCSLQEWLVQSKIEIDNR